LGRFVVGVRGGKSVACEVIGVSGNVSLGIGDFGQLIRAVVLEGSGIVQGVCPARHVAYRIIGHGNHPVLRIGDGGEIVLLVIGKNRLLASSSL
jgi:hypothetical protein